SSPSEVAATSAANRTRRRGNAASARLRLGAASGDPSIRTSAFERARRAGDRRRTIPNIRPADARNAYRTGCDGPDPLGHSLQQAVLANEAVVDHPGEVSAKEQDHGDGTTPVQVGEQLGELLVLADRYGQGQHPEHRQRKAP